VQNLFKTFERLLWKNIFVFSLKGRLCNKWWLAFAMQDSGAQHMPTSTFKTLLLHLLLDEIILEWQTRFLGHKILFFPKYYVQ
jgi:hypothetical protein